MSAVAEINGAKTPPERIVAFREAFGLDQADLDRLLGFSSKGRATRRWESEGAPAYVEVLLTYLERHGLDEAEKIAKQREAA